MDPIRQGDILLDPIEDETFINRILEHGKVETRGSHGWIVAEGEATGHHHRIRTRGVRIINHGSRRFVHVPKGKTALFTHEEHETLQVPGGVHEIVHQVEYQPNLAPRRVYD